ncbi:MAG: copper-binding protein [Burkholderiales bacterium]
MKKFGLSLFSVGCLIISSYLLAAHHEQMHEGNESHLEETEWHTHRGGLPIVHGIVKKINTASGSITLKHADIPNLEMSAMTMGFSVKDAAMLDGLTEGDHVMFQAIAEGGKFIIVSMKKDQH